MLNKPKPIYPIKCPHCGENSYWNKDFTLNRKGTNSSKRMKDREDNFFYVPFGIDKRHLCHVCNEMVVNGHKHLKGIC